jgi:hypothetical protein
MCVLKNLRIVL